MQGPAVLIMAPTRELATQISEVAESAGAALGLKTTCIFGGVPKPPQQQALKRGVHIAVATPGRLFDLVDDGSFVLKNVTYLVLDEADRYDCNTYSYLKYQCWNIHLIQTF